MSLHHPPLYRYSLSDEWDQSAFAYFTQVGQRGNYPLLKGTETERNLFLVTLLRTQKSFNDWRDLLKEVLAQAQHSGVIEVAVINAHYPPSSISQGRSAWAVYSEDQIVDDFLDELATRPVRFIGTEAELSEFVLRFMLSQLGHDWEWAIMLVWEILGDEETVGVRELNKELRYFDYAHLFDSSQ